MRLSPLQSLHRPFAYEVQHKLQDMMQDLVASCAAKMKYSAPSKLWRNLK